MALPAQRGSWRIVWVILAAPVIALVGDRAGGDLGYFLALLVVALLAFLIA